TAPGPPPTGGPPPRPTLALSSPQTARRPHELGYPAQLESLSMIENRLEALPDSITRLANLRRLEVKQAPHLRTLPEHIGRLSKLEALGLQMTKLEALPESIGDLENLTELTLSSVPLSTLPDSFARLRLRQLALGGTRFTSPPAALQAMEDLEELRLFGDNEPPFDLGELFASLGRLPKLSLLVVNDLRGAEPLQGRKDYVRMPPSMGDLRSVRELYLGGSWPPWVGELPSTVLQLENLRELAFADLAFEGPAEVTARLPKGRWRRTENSDGTMYRRTDAE
ncbi:MAG: leucine-rich repeat domain-containing protein, partial [Kofleriaceae bacterium]